MNSHTPAEIAKVIQPQFVETNLETLTTIVTRYYDQETWKTDLVFSEESFDLLQNILEEAGVLDARAPYSNLINTDYAKKAAESYKQGYKEQAELHLKEIEKASIQVIYLIDSLIDEVE